ncbi:MAG: nucleotide exchange factor GrpE [Niabella sp.]
MNNKNDFQEDFNPNADENMSGTEKLNDPIDSSELEAIENELNDSKDKYLRLAAEFDNFRRRTAKEKTELFQTAGKDVITDLLEVLDDAERATKQLEKSEDNNVKEGVSLVFNKLKNILQAKGLKEMQSVGTEFDPELHEAITEIPAPSDDLKGKVVDEVSKGYYLNDKIIRHPKVVVGK